MQKTRPVAKTDGCELFVLYLTFSFFFFLIYCYHFIFHDNHGKQRKCKIVKYSLIFVLSKKAIMTYEQCAFFDSD